MNACIRYHPFTLPLIVVMLLPGLSSAQSKAQNPPWPDNIIITKRLMGVSKLDEDRMARAEAALPAMCSLLGKRYEQGAMTKIEEGDFVIGETTYLAGRQRLVITEKLMTVNDEERDCISRYQIGWTYNYSAPGVAWTVYRSPNGAYAPERSGRDSPQVMQTQERAFQRRRKDFEGKWRTKKYEDVEVHFGQRCGYPVNPANLPRPKGMGEYGAFYDKAVAAAQQFHQEGTKLCSLIDSPEHVGTGEKLVLHVKESKRNYDEKTGCYDFEEQDSFVKRKCAPIVIDFQINAAMPPRIFEKPDWARDAAPKSIN